MNCSRYIRLSSMLVNFGGNRLCIVRLLGSGIRWLRINSRMVIV